MFNKSGAYSKEAIKARMLKNAVKIWGLKSITSVDPFVKLLIESFSTEIFKIANDVQTSQSRITEKMARLLTPSLYTHPRPAHAVGITLPIEKEEFLPEYTEFFTQKQIVSNVKGESDDTLTFSFTPVDAVRLYRMQVSCLLTETSYSIFDEFHQKIPMGKLPKRLRGNSITIGIDVSSYKGKIPNQLALYCSNPAFEALDFVWKLLPFVSIRCNDKELTVTKGFPYESKEYFNSLSGYEEIFNEYTLEHRIQESVKNIYEAHFIQISGLSDSLITTKFPDSLACIDTTEVVSALLKPKMLWLEIVFPVQYTPDIIEGFSFALNAFPIYNRSWKNNTGTLDVMGNTVPLLTRLHEYFLYPEKVEDSYGNSYQNIPFVQNDDLGQGLYSIRKGGMERFDQRSAVDMMTGLLELVRDEVSAFSVYRRDDVIESIKKMILQMRTLQQQTLYSDKNIKQEVHYAVINPLQKAEYFKVSYWVTHCEMANNLRAYTTLKPLKRVISGNTRDLILLTDTVGGARQQQGTNAVEAYKYALTTRDRIITKEDIKSFCRLLLQDDLKAVEIKRGMIISDLPKEGFVRTIEVEITPVSYAVYGKNYWDKTALSIKAQIASKSIDGVEFVVRILNKD
ncbi:type VI secretion system baseplate subunit TssF [Capnocytophaga canimorsus]|uniref:type VI secretion system baseplate subunit TssF n=1 Tax=Capnocytophaga canimorsus TaxID=28188 RepID=UPI001AC318ED|nr:type VI secretion system baseplate subunit TssF [Capnocytophaga canimorsus]GIM57384.1 hypothetical protein CAPN006_17770 [Capnocytophaga canimorsus]